jgi:cyclopropane fatty-acyl-phospholipid synthase-like methyltransferase
VSENQHFDQVAESWDEKPDRVDLAVRIATTLLERVELDAGMEVLDFGCGTGLLSLPWAGRVKTLVGLDSSPGMLAVFAEKARRMGLENVQTLEPNRSGQIAGRYDLVVSSMVFHHVENIPALLKNIYSALKPGGWLYVADLDPDGGLFHSRSEGIFHQGFDRVAFRELWENAGFSEVSATSVTVVKKISADGQERCFGISLMGGQKR